MRRILGVVSVLVVAVLMAQFAPAVMIGAQVWTGILHVPSSLEEPAFLVLAGLAASLLAFALVWAAVRLARAPGYAWLGVLVPMGFMIGGLGWDDTAPPVAWIGATAIVAGSSAAGYLGGRLARRSAKAREDVTGLPAVR